MGDATDQRDTSQARSPHSGKTPKSIACRICHRRKVKCSGEQPCVSCRQSGTECIYPARDRKSKVSERYLKNVVEENKRLREALSASATPRRSPAPATSDTADETERNPVMDERPWFVPLNAHEIPAYVGEAADAAFATRVRQAISGTPCSHIPRVHYLSDDQLRALSVGPLEWPSVTRTRFLIDVALKTVCRSYHIVRKSVVLASLQAVLSDPNFPDWLYSARLWALLALGEAYSSRSVLSEDAFPGARYFCRAMSLVSMPNERPKLELIEVYLLLSLYSSVANRRYTASFMASSAVRTALTLGLHLEVPPTQLQDKSLRAHRCRVWWTAYSFDRIWASKIGQSASVPDDIIETGWPVSYGEGLPDSEDFADNEYGICYARLARLSYYVLEVLYRRQKHASSFSDRVQTAVRELSDWADQLPERLRIVNPGDSNRQDASLLLHLKLSFNQAVILATRPVLLHLLRASNRNQSGNSPSQPPIEVPSSGRSLAEACVRCARHSHKLLSAAWADGSFPTFDYFNTQYLFSAATILLLSSQLRQQNWQEDHECFSVAVGFLQQLAHSGSMAAKEYCLQFDAIGKALAQSQTFAPGVPIGNQASWPLTGGSMQPQLSSVATPDLGIAETFVGLGAGGQTLEDQPLRDFLSLPEMDLQFMDSLDWNTWQDPSWPGLDQ